MNPWRGTHTLAEIIIDSVDIGKLMREREYATHISYVDELTSDILAFESMVRYRCRQFGEYNYEKPY